MDVIAAYESVGTFRGAAELCGTTHAGFPYEQRIRSGITVTKAYGYEGPLTDEQFEAIEADPQLVLVKPEEKPASKAQKPAGK